MNISSLFRLILLAAIWGGSFIFMRVSAPVLGSIALIEARIGFAALFLFLCAFYLKRRTKLLEHWRYFLLMGFLNSAFPFFMFAYSAQTITASLLSILNATTPIWGTIIGALWHKRILSIKVLTGMCLGITGVGILVGFDNIVLQEGAKLAILAALVASFSYGIASVYAESAPRISAFDNAHGSLWAATFIIMPFVPFFPVNSMPDGNVIVMVILLGVLCTGIAYLLYFQLIADIGAPSTLTVTFIVPVFGTFWGWLFLNELIGWHTIFGGVFILAGTALVTGFSLNQLFATRR